ncbi:hypothetical protein CTAYLR_010362 [Chrysophaeum taylorii]|uniref:Uncharacterized protein n=1 Tax=Chrysophaeum taylorii TaxID=2483200 RepID=A0AAD7U924_9STRA|nr:hypothetical protein CTAYLR_010362 [Chrysophaeum taylorii]
MWEALEKMPLGEIERVVGRSQELGAQAFKARDFGKATEYYTTVIAGTQYLAEKDAANIKAITTAVSNRSASRLRIDVEGSLSDARECVRLRPEWQKSWFRLGRALLAKGAAAEAEAAFAEGIQLDTSNAEMIRWRAKAREKMAEQRAAELKKRRYQTDYSKFRLEEEAEIGAVEDNKPVINSIEEMHDLMAKKQQAQLDQQPAVELGFTAAMLEGDLSDSIEEESTAAMARWLDEASALQEPRRVLDSSERWLEEAVEMASREMDARGVDGLWLFVGCGSGAALEKVGGGRRVDVYPTQGPFVTKACRSRANARARFVQEQPLLATFEVEEKATVVVLAGCFDAGLLGRGLVPFARHCRRHLAVPHALVIPRRARVFATPVRVSIPSPCGFDFGILDDEYRWGPWYDEVDEGGLQTVELLAAGEEVFCFELMGGDLPVSDASDLEFRVPESSIVNGIAFWFSAELLPGGGGFGGEGKKAWSSPFGDKKKAVQWVDPVSCGSGVLRIRASHNSTRLKFRVLEPRRLPAVYEAYVSRWHLDMVSDGSRNAAFEKGIEHVVVKGKRVVDFGTGTGLLAFLAERHGAASVTGFETRGHLVSLARRLAKINNMTKCKFVHKDCRHLVMGKDLKHKCDVLVLELFDYGFLGEGVLHFVHFAWRSCLAENARVVPRGGRIRAQLVHLPVDDDAWKPYQYAPDYYGIDLSATPHSRLTDPFAVFEFDFDDQSKFKLPPERGDERLIDARVVESGVANAVVFWHDLQLAPGVEITTSPDGPRKSCWLQACQPLPPTKVVEGAAVSVRARHQGSRCTFGLDVHHHVPLDPRWVQLHASLADRAKKLEKTLAFNSKAKQQAADALLSIALDPARFATHGFCIDGATAQDMALSFFST